MPEYQVKGVTKIGKKVETTIVATNPKEALKIIYKTYGKLRKGFDIYISTFLKNTEDYFNNPMAPLTRSMSDQEVIDIAEKIRNGGVTAEEYSLFHTYFRPMLQAAIRSLWNDIVIVTREEKEHELLQEIALKFILRYDPTRGKLRPFIKMNIQSSLIDEWNEEIYVNPRNGKSRPRYLEDQEYIRRNAIVHEGGDLEEQQDRIIKIGKRIVEEDVKLSVDAERIFFGRIVELNLHKKFLKRSIQIKTLELSYGEERMTAKEIATLQGIRPQSAQENKQNAERNILKYIKKYL